MTRQDAANLLPYVLQHQRLMGKCVLWSIFGWAGAVVGLSALSKFGNAPGLRDVNQVLFIWGLAAGAVVLSVLLFLEMRWRAGIRRQAAACEHRMCAHCRYDLSKAPPIPETEGSVRCSESGEAVNVSEVQKLWTTWLEG